MFLDSLAVRQREEELMDGPDVEPALLLHSLRFIRNANRMLGYTRATVSHLERFSQRWQPDSQITILDVATGSADIPRAIVEWANRRKFSVRVVGLDRHPLTAREAEEESASDPHIKIIRGDATVLPFEDGSFDYVMTNMFLHHLDDEDVVRVLSEMNRVAKRGIIAADLARDKRAYAWATFFTLFANPMLKHDARVSVSQAFTADEMLALAERASITYASSFSHFAHRFVIAGEKK